VQGLELTAQMHTSGAAVRRVFDEQTTAAGLTGLVHKWALPDPPHFGGLNLASLPALQVSFSPASPCSVADTHGASRLYFPYQADACCSQALERSVFWASLSFMPQAACKTLALLVAGSGTARQQCMGDSAAGWPGWPEVSAAVRQVTCFAMLMLDYFTGSQSFWIATEVQENDAVCCCFAVPQSSMAV
jgi:hypothetical protein